MENDDEKLALEKKLSELDKTLLNLKGEIE